MLRLINGIGRTLSVMFALALAAAVMVGIAPPAPAAGADADRPVGAEVSTTSNVSTASLPAGVTLTGDPDFVLNLDCNVLTGNPVLNVPHYPGGSLTVNTTGTCTTLGVAKFNAAISGTTGLIGGQFAGFNPTFEVLPNTRVQRGQSPSFLIINYYYSYRPEQASLLLLPGAQTRTSTVGGTVSSNPITADGFSAAPTYTVSPALPSGVVLDPASGAISGTPTASSAQTTYTITATNGSEVATSKLTLTVFEYTVLFQAGSGGTVSPTAVGVVADGDSITLPTPTKPNNSFNGWFTAATGGTLVGQGGDPYVPTSTIVLYAQWTPPYSVSINRQGGSGSTTPLSVVPGNSVNLPTQTNRSALTFAGWFDSASGSTKLGDAGDPYTPTSSTTIYAQWNATLSYSLGGGSLPGSSTQVVNINQTPTITLPAPTRSGYSFNGWFSSTSSSATKFGDAGDAFTVTENDTLYAKWTLIAYATFLPGDHGQTVTDGRCEADPNAPTACRILWQTNALVLPTPTSPSGLTFDGWYLNSLRVGGGGDTWSRTPYNASLTTRWTGTITFDANGGTINTPSRSTRAGWNTFTEVPYRPGFAFEGWFTSGGTLALPRQTDSFTMTSTDTWTARWLQDPSAPELVSAELSDDRKTIRMEFSGDVQALYGNYMLCWDLVVKSTPKDSSFDNGSTRSCTITGSVVEMVPTGNPLALTSTGLTIAYDGRSLADANDATVYVAQTADFGVDGATPNYTITFDPMDGTVPLTDITAAMGSEITLPRATREGFDFQGWFDDTVGTTLLGIADDTFIVTADDTLYAQWSLTPEPDPAINAGPPASIRATAGDASARVTWSRPASTGDYPVTTYQVVGSPSGGCLVQAPARSCVITGLTNGEDYTFTVRALTGAGWSPYSDASAPVTPQAEAGQPALPTPEPEAPTAPVNPGDSIATEDGQPVPVTVDTNTQGTGLSIVGDGFDMNLDGVDSRGTPIGLSADGVLLLTKDRRVAAQGNGFAPGAPIAFYLYPPTGQSVAGGDVRMMLRAAGEPILLDTVTVDNAGRFTGTLILPPGMASGDYLVQAVGEAMSGVVRSVTLGVRVEASASILITGSRAEVRGREGVQVRGVTTGLEGVVVTPRIRLGKEESYTNGVGLRTVGTDGVFEWERITSRWVYVYFRADDVRSNRIVIRRD